MAIKVETTVPLNPKRSKHHKLIIKKNMYYLCYHTTNMSELSLLLVSFGVIQLDLRDEIMATEVELEQCYKLYAHISRNNDDSFQHLLVALRRSGNTEVLQFLQDSFESDIHNAESSDGFPDSNKFFSGVRKRDILLFCSLGFATAILQ